jgi:hypothetical protein
MWLLKYLSIYNSLALDIPLSEMRGHDPREANVPNRCRCTYCDHDALSPIEERMKCAYCMGRRCRCAHGATAGAMDKVQPRAPRESFQTSDVMVGREIKADIDRLWAKMPYRAEKLFVLAYRDELTFAEIAKILRFRAMQDLIDTHAIWLRWMQAHMAEWGPGGSRSPSAA